MAGSIFGTLFRVSTFGESHGTALGAVIDGCPAGLPLSAEEIQAYLNRRKPGQSAFTTPRKEADACEILSGVFEGKTLGTPIAVLVRNKDQHSADYQAIWDCYRPGHADFGFDQKFGFRDPRGGGRSSGRETIGRVIGGAIAAKLLAEFGIRAFAYVSAVGAIEAATFDEAVCAENPLGMPDAEAATRATEYLKEVMRNRDSLGGTVSCRVTGMFPGLGEPVFDKLDAELAKAVMSIGAVKGVEFGDGFEVSTKRGSEDNDAFCPGQGGIEKKSNHAGGMLGGISDGSDILLRAAVKGVEFGDGFEVSTKRGSEDNDAFCPGQGGIEKKSNHAGGMLGGISDGSDILLRAAVKATPSIGSPQETVNKNGEPVTIEIQGRHDPTIMPRAAVVVESMVNLVLADLLLRNSVSTVEKLKRAAGRA